MISTSGPHELRDPSTARENTNAIPGLASEHWWIVEVRTAGARLQRVSLAIEPHCIKLGCSSIRIPLGVIKRAQIEWGSVGLDG